MDPKSHILDFFKGVLDFLGSVRALFLASRGLLSLLWESREALKNVDKAFSAVFIRINIYEAENNLLILNEVIF